MGRFFQAVWRWCGGRGYQRDCRHVKDAADAAATGRRDPRADAHPGGPLDFADYVRQYRLTDADLRRRQRRLAIEFYLLFGAALFALGFGATTAVVTFGPGLALVDGLLALLFLAGAAARSLRAWQIRERRLGSFGEWARRPREWFPPPFV